MKAKSGLPPVFVKKCYQASLVSHTVKAPAFQNDVISAFHWIGLDPKKEVRTKTGYSLDSLVELNGKRFGIERLTVKVISLVEAKSQMRALC